MIVYKQYNQEQLNGQYNTRLHVPGYAKYFERWEKLSRETEKQHRVVKDVSFGKNEKERMDIYPATASQSRVVVFLHGGYWHLLDKSMFHFLAEHYLSLGVTTVLVNYPLAPLVDIGEIVLSCRKALRWLYGNVEGFNGDPSQLYVIGHSAGGHLASMLMVENELNFIKGIVSLSGLFRLEPVMRSYINEAIEMNDKTAFDNSPVFLNPAFDCPLLLVTGIRESDEFKDQSEELYNRWQKKLDKIELITVPGKNHYSILESVVEKGNVVHDAMIRLLNLN
jgi:arylformamidase